MKVKCEKAYQQIEQVGDQYNNILNEQNQPHVCTISHRFDLLALKKMILKKEGKTKQSSKNGTKNTKRKVHSILAARRGETERHQDLDSNATQPTPTRPGSLGTERELVLLESKGDKH